MPITWQDHNYKRESRDFLTKCEVFTHYCLRSGEESRFARLLEIMVMAGQVRRWWYEPHRFSLGFFYNKKRVYTPDFLVSLNKGNVFEIEATSCWFEIKATLTQKDVSRFRWFKAKYPNLPILLMMGYNYKADRPSKTCIRQAELAYKAEKYCERVLIAKDWRL